MLYLIRLVNFKLFVGISLTLGEHNLKSLIYE